MQRLRKRIHVSPATAIATLALVFAMTGGAYAAKHYLITNTKQISPKVLKQLRGKNGKNGVNGAQGVAGAAGVGTPGAQGPVGAAGPQGPAGAAGAKGENGTNGTNGVSAEGKSFTGAKGSCTEGGVEVKSASPAANVCNGTEGSPWVAGGTLPAGKTLEGEWSVSGYGAAAGQTSVGSVSYALPLATAPAVHYIRHEENDPAGCKGNAEKPEAEPGNLCVFASEEENSFQEATVGTLHYYFPTLCQWETGTCNVHSPNGEGEASTRGFGIDARTETEGTLKLYGTWAVTAG